MDNLRVLTTFIRIADTGSFRKAAHELGITPQGASNHIKQLEDWVGVRLFNRTTRKVNLTPEGMSFYDTCSVAMHTIEKGVETLHQTSERIVGNVRVAAPYGFGWRFVAPALTRFLDLYPDVNVELVVQNQVPDLVAQGIDVGILGDPLPDSSMIAKKFATMQQVLCAAPSYLQRYGIPTEIEDLAHHRCINMRNWITGKVMPWMFRKPDGVVTQEVQARFTANDGDCELQAVLNGGGIAQLSAYRVASYVREKRLKVVLMKYAFDKYSFYIYLPHRKHVPKKNRALADFLFKELSNHPDLKPLVGAG